MAKELTLPNDIFVEKSLIGGLMVDGRTFNDIVDLKISPEDFYDPRCGVIFEAIRKMAMDNKPIQYSLVRSELNHDGLLPKAGGDDYLLEIVDSQKTSANILHYAKVVKDKALLRSIIRTARDVASDGISFKGKIRDFIQEVEGKFFKFTKDVQEKGMVELNEALKQNMIDLEKNAGKKGDFSGLRSGYQKLDEILLGMQAGQLIILAARPAMGKTSFALNLAVNACESSALPVAVFSLEMLAKELSLRVLSSKAKVDSKKFKRGDLGPHEYSNLSTAVRELSELNLYIYDTGVSALDILSHCRKLKTEKGGLGMVVVDYLQLLRPNPGTISREQQIAEMSRYLKEMAKELECPVLCLSQLNRGVESRPDKRPNVSDLRESGAIEQDADIVMMIYRDEVYNPDTTMKGVAEVIVGKNRSGETGTAKLAWVGSYTSFENLAAGPDFGSNAQDDFPSI